MDVHWSGHRPRGAVTGTRVHRRAPRSCPPPAAGRRRTGSRLPRRRPPVVLAERRSRRVRTSRRVDFPDASHGWAVADGGTIIATDDGGLTWKKQSSRHDARLTVVSLPDACSALAVG